MKIISVLLLILSSTFLQSQTVIKGSLIDKTTKETLPYVNIGVIGKNLGTVSDINGNFKIELPKQHDNDTLRISMIGYETLDFIASDFKKKNQEK